MEKRIGTIHPPEKALSIPTEAQWLLGQGAGVWFYIQKEVGNEHYNIKRFAPNGDVDCDRLFELEDNGSVFDINSAYEFVHVSHCAKCRIKQKEIVFVFNYKGE